MEITDDCTALDTSEAKEKAEGKRQEKVKQIMYQPAKAMEWIRRK